MAANLYEMQTRTQLALEAAGLGMWTWDIATDVLEWDNRTAHTWRLPPGAAPTMSAIDALIHPEDREFKQKALRHALDPANDGTYNVEYRIVGSGVGSGQAVERRVASLGKTEFQDGKPVRVIGIIRDVTERRHAEDAVRRSEARLAGIVSIAADAIISIDGKQRITLFNRGAETAFGYAPEEVIGQPLELLLPERFRAAHGGHIRQFAAAQTSARLMGERRDIFGVRKDGHEFPAEASISKLDIDGERTFTVVLRDITTRKATEQALAQVNRDLETRVAERTGELHEEMHRREQAQAALTKAQRMEAFGQLTGGIAHDFNNLLTVITGNQELLEMRLKDPKDLTLLKRAQEAAEMGARLTGRLLTFARRRQLEPTLLNLNEQITGMVELLRRSIGEDVTLTTNLAPRLWTVRADPSEIENAVLNLAINARDAMPKGGTVVIETAECSIDDDEIGTGAKLPAGDYVRIAVSDTGVGMTHDVLSRAFEPFFTTKPAGKGTGLGLSTIYGFVQQSGGTVTAYSEVGRGTTINIYLPRVIDGTKAAKQKRQDDVPIAVSGERVLLVEDRADVRDATRARLEQLGYGVVEAESGAEAIELLRASNQNVNIVFSDVVMPGGMSGFDVARWVQSNKPGLKVLLTSGFSEQVASALDGALPDVKVLRKPYSRIELARALRDALDR